MMSQRFYTEGKYLKNNPTWHTEDSIWKAQQIIKMIKNSKLQVSSVAEIGCGSGEILNQLYLQMPDLFFYGYEISPQAFELCQKRRKANLNFYLSDLLQEETTFFDLLLCIDVFEHIEDYFNFLRYLKEKARNHIFHIPLDLSVSSLLRSSPILYARKNVGHLHYFTKETALETLKDTGYEIIDYFYTAGAIELSTRGLKTLLANIPRKFMYRFNPDLAVRCIGGYSLMVLTQ